ncbi:MAG: Asp-tRNA(Asn)/Glu-tRNA(Gln) amidotransferase subunit GatA [Candidatus Paceibacterota bacterium]
MKLDNLTIEDVRTGLKEKEFSATELAEAHFDKIQKKDEDISAFLTLTKEKALSQAEEVDEWIEQGRDLPPLAGVPVAFKDNMLLEGEKCTAGSKILENYEASYDASVVEFLRGQGSIFLGKTNMDEFAMGSSTENSAFGPTKNPHDLDKVPGGSSGGSAAAVAADMSVVALGSDTGGSVRQPASFCGAVGFKPTYGAVSRYGLIAMASSLDQIGPFAKNVNDAKLVFEAIQNKDRFDSTSVDRKLAEEEVDLEEMTIGVPKEYFSEGLDEKVEKKIKKVIEKVGEYAEIKEISLPHSEYALPVYYIIMSAEVSANLARYDGIKYGATEEADNLLEFYSKTRGQNFGKEVRRRLMLGTYTLSSGYYDAYYKRAQKVRTLIKKDFKQAFNDVDLILTPTSPTPAFELGAKSDPLSMYLSDIYTASVNLAGLPGVSVPIGKVPAEPESTSRPPQAEGLPVGLQIIGDVFEDYQVLNTAQKIEQLI